MKHHNTSYQLIADQIKELINSGEDNFIEEALTYLNNLTVGMSEINQDVQEYLRLFRKAKIGFNTKEKEISKICKYVRSVLEERIPKHLKLNNGSKELRMIIYQDPIPEKIIAFNMRSIEWLKIAVDKSKAICRIWVDNEPQGTGFLVKDGYVFTNNHVINSIEKAGQSMAEFNFDGEKDEPTGRTVKYKLDPSDFITDTMLDYTRVKVADSLEYPLSQWGVIEVEDSIVQAGDTVNIIHHPAAKHKHVSLIGKLILGQKGYTNDKLIYYEADTLGGSSGSPVFNDDWKAIALHRSAFPEANGGTLFYYILEDIKKKEVISKPYEYPSAQFEHIRQSEPPKLPIADMLLLEKEFDQLLIFFQLDVTKPGDCIGMISLLERIKKHDSLATDSIAYYHFLEQTDQLIIILNSFLRNFSIAIDGKQKFELVDKLRKWKSFFKEALNI